MRRSIALMVSVALFALIAAPASASDRVSDTPRVADQVTEIATDRATGRVTDRVTDIVTDRYRCRDAVTDRRCLDDRHPHDVNLRALIHRLINAGEWEKLFRLLHRLGII